MPASITDADIGSAEAGFSIPTVILAGGRAIRMAGADKTMLHLGRQSVLAHILQGLRGQTGPFGATPIALNANGDAARFSAYGLPVLPDLAPDQPGPLAGILAGMIWARPLCDRVLSWPGDTPWPPCDLLARLLATPGAGVVCAASNGRLHPVIGVWPVGLAERLADRLRRGDHRVRDFAATAGLTVVEWRADPDPFMNINTPADLDAAAARLADDPAG